MYHEEEKLAVLVILNVCVLMFHYSSSYTMSLFYLLVMNGIIKYYLDRRVQDEHVARTSLSADILEGNKEKESEIEEIAKLNQTSLNCKPLAGSTYQFVDAVVPNVPINSWSKCDHTKFDLRIGPNYAKEKKKAPSAAPLYELFAVDVFSTDRRIDNVTSRMELPDTSDLEIANEHVPAIFVVQLQIPSKPPPMISTVEDGPGWAIVLYFKMTKETCDQLGSLESASSAVKLFAQWCEKSEDPAWKSRFKIIASCLNLEDLGMPSLVRSYNAKPVLIRKTSSVFKTPAYIELCIHVFKFANMAKSTIHMITSRCGSMFMEIGFVIEGREDSELPEALVGCASINRPQENEIEYLYS